MKNKYITINGECLEEMQKLINNNVVVDLIVCDPPYGTTDLGWDVVLNMEKLTPLMWKLLKTSGRALIFGNSPFYDEFLYMACKGVKKNNRTQSPYFSNDGELIWIKSSASNPLGANQQLMRHHEKIMILTKDYFYWKAKEENLDVKKTYNPYTKEIDYLETKKWTIDSYSKKEYNSLKTGMKHLALDITNTKDLNKHENRIVYKNYPRSYFECGKDANQIHPTQKPQKLLEHLIKLYSNENETILDFTMGSGSTGVACKNTNRSFIGIELDKEYYNNAKSWIENPEKHQIETKAKKENSENQINIFQILE